MGLQDVAQVWAGPYAELPGPKGLTDGSLLTMGCWAQTSTPHGPQRYCLSLAKPLRAASQSLEPHRGLLFDCV